jgi:putative ABC transport system substrate-binding protein
MRRRDFITLLGGAAAAWPVAARAQRGGVRRIGVLLAAVADDPIYQTRFGAFLQALGQSGWIIGSNVGIDTRWATTNAAEVRRHATELVALTPDIILTAGGTAAGALQQATRTVPIVFVNVTDPVGRGLVDSLARPGGNVTGFTPFEFSISAKWLELLKQVAPGLRRVAVIWDPAAVGPVGNLAALQSVAPAFGVELRPINARDADAIERGVLTFTRGSDDGLIVTDSRFATIHRDLIVTLAARHRLPAVYPYRFYATGGGLMSYGPDLIDQYRQAAGYVDRILKGDKPADLPVQAPAKYELVINLKTAKALGLTVPPTLLAIADELIE